LKGFDVQPRRLASDLRVLALFVGQALPKKDPRFTPLRTQA
jgi:hypothetical protein